MRGSANFDIIRTMKNLTSVVCLAAAFALPASVVTAAETPLLKIAVMSDIQGYPHPEDAGMRNVERALDVFEKLKPDLVLNDGDINDSGRDMDAVRYYKARCDARLGKIPHVCCAGNHEIGFIPKEQQSVRTPEACIAEFNAVFGEGPSPLVEHTLAGYDFIALGLRRVEGYPEEDLKLLEGAIERAVRRDASKPVFVITHYHPRNTVNSSSEKHGEGLRKLLDRYPQVINLSGHSHNPLQDPRSIWQGGFTAIDTATLCYGCLDAPRPCSNQISCLIPYGHEAVGFLFLELYRDRLVIRRFTARDRRELDPENPWCMRLPYDPKHPQFDFASRTASSPAPQLPADAEPTIWYDYGLIYLLFKPAVDPTSVYSYRIELEEKGGKTTSHFLLSDYYRIPGHRQDRVVFRLPEKATRPGASYRCRIYPVGFFGQEGRPCAWEFVHRAGYPETDLTPNCMQE